MGNIVTAVFEKCSHSDGTHARTEPLWQYDYGQVLRFEGVELPDAYEVHFSDTDKGTSKTVIGNADGVDVPDEYLLSGKQIYAWVYLHTGESDGETEYSVSIPVNRRSQPTDQEPTPVQQSAIDQAIAALQVAVEKCEGNVEHYPKIIDNYWYVWDADEEDFVNTGVDARGLKGDPGYYYTPDVSQAGVISWTNNGGLPNPDPVDLAGVIHLDDYATKAELEEESQSLAHDISEVNSTLSGEIAATNLEVANKIDLSQKGANGGVAELDAEGKVITSQLPSFVDDVLEYAARSMFPTRGEAGKIYVSTSNNQTYRWSGSTYVAIGSSLALGETSSTAYRGDRGAQAFTHAVINKGSQFASGVYKFATNSEGHVIQAETPAAADIPGMNDKADKTGTVLNTTLSMGRKAGTIVGNGSTALGYDVTANGSYSHAEGAGTTASGNDAHAEGTDTSANGYSSHAEGCSTVAGASYSHAEGYQTKSLEYATHAEGYATTASSQYAHAEGANTKATDMAAHAEGYLTEANEDASHAEGYRAKANGIYSHAEGYYTVASARSSHAEGEEARATGQGAHAEGVRSSDSTTYNGSTIYYGANGDGAHSEGYNTAAQGAFSHAEGAYGLALESSAHVEGSNAIASNYAAHAEGYTTIASGYASHAEGYGGTFTAFNTTYTSGATGQAAHSEGNQTVASGSSAHAEGHQTIATNASSHAEGAATVAAAEAAHAEGKNTVASGNYSHAEGYGTTAPTSYSHAEGDSTVASGTASHAEGCGTIASGNYLHVSGKYNVPLTTYAEIVGNGEDANNRANIRALDWDGNAYFKGTVFVGCTNSSTGGTKLEFASDAETLAIISEYGVTA